MRLFLLVSLCCPLFLWAQDAQKVLIPYYKDGLYGYVDKQKNTVIEPHYTQANPFGFKYKFSSFPDLAFVVYQEQDYLIDRDGNLTLLAPFLAEQDKQDESPVPRQEEVAFVDYQIFNEEGKKGIIDHLGEIILPATNKYISLYKFRTPYQDKKTKKYKIPVFASVQNDDGLTLYRLDEFQHYNQIQMTSFSANSNHIIVKIKTTTQEQYGILFQNQLVLVDPRYTYVGKYYEEEEIMYTTITLNGRRTTVYLGLDGTPYYEE